jgi:hypothetical protein
MPVEILYPGTFRGHRGGDFTFTREDLQKSIEAYDPKLHKAPIVLGHPKTADPSMGYVDSMEWNPGETRLIAHSTKVQPAFAEAVKSGGFSKVSAAFYKPDDVNNPVPGVWYLRHLGFLGATPPAVKGLKDAVFNPEELAPAFSESGDIVEISQDISRLEFAEEEINRWDLNWKFRAVGRLLRNIKNKFIELYSQEEADKLLDEYELEAVLKEVETIKPPVFGEEKKSQEEDDDMTDREKELEQELADAKSAKAESDKRAELAEQKLKSEQGTRVKDKAVAFAEGWVKDGRVDLKAKEKTVSSLLTIAQGSAEFAEGGNQDMDKVAAEFAEMLPPAGTYRTHEKEKFSKDNAADVQTPEFEEESDAEFSEEVDEYAKAHNLSYDEATEKVLSSKR